MDCGTMSFYRLTEPATIVFLGSPVRNCRETVGMVDMIQMALIYS
jgi:hypothetical protein